MTSTTPQTQKALLLDGSPGKLSIKSIPIPQPKQGEVLVKVVAGALCRTVLFLLIAYLGLTAALNPLDYKIADGSLKMLSKFPAILGSDSAGVVVALGPGVTGLEIGDRV